MCKERNASIPIDHYSMLNISFMSVYFPMKWVKKQSSSSSSTQSTIQRATGARPAITPISRPDPAIREAPLTTSVGEPPLAAFVAVEVEVAKGLAAPPVAVAA